ncbi:hypothetical protein ACLOJK_007284, partial [Asimina triloba]
MQLHMLLYHFGTYAKVGRTRGWLELSLQRDTAPKQKINPPHIHLYHKEYVDSSILVEEIEVDAS